MIKAFKNLFLVFIINSPLLATENLVPQKVFQICLMNGESYQITLNMPGNIRSLKNKIKEQKGTAIENQKLFSQGSENELQSLQSLEDLPDVLFLIIEPQQLQQVPLENPFAQ